MFWIKPLCPENGPSPASLYKVDDRGSTDTEYPSISILSLDSLDELSKKVGSELDPRRFRGNIWLQGGEPFEEFNWIDQEIDLGNVKVKVLETIERCNATMWYAGASLSNSYVFSPEQSTILRKAQ